MTEKISVTQSFQGATLELRNAFDYPEKDRQTGLPTGKTAKARAGLYLHIAGGKSIDFTGIDLAGLSEAHKLLLKKPAAKGILEEIALTR